MSLDLGTTDAWSVNDEPLVGHRYTADELKTAAAHGWSMEANVRLTAANASIGENVIYSRVNDWRFVIQFTTDENAIPTVRVHPATDTTYTLDSPGYHRYKLVVDARGKADLFIDGVKRISGVYRDPDPGKNVTGFAGISSYWNEFRATVGPDSADNGDSGRVLFGDPRIEFLEVDRIPIKKETAER